MVCACLVLSGCKSFDSQWQAAAAAESPQATGLQGRWQGIWASEATGHTDKLRCIIEPEPDGKYRARFHAKYKKVLSFGYTVLLTAEPDGGLWKFKGDANLGWYAGGLYHYEGQADETNLHSTYSCKYDHGTFRMQRCCFMPLELNRPGARVAPWPTVDRASLEMLQK
jgi:hypothetical protein